MVLLTASFGQATYRVQLHGDAVDRRVVDIVEDTPAFIRAATGGREVWKANPRKEDGACGLEGESWAQARRDVYGEEDGWWLPEVETQLSVHPSRSSLAVGVWHRGAAAGVVYYVAFRAE